MNQKAKHINELNSPQKFIFTSGSFIESLESTQDVNATLAQCVTKFFMQHFACKAGDLNSLHKFIFTTGSFKESLQSKQDARATKLHNVWPTFL